MMKKNEKKLLKDQISNLLSCGYCGCCWRGAFGVKKGRNKSKTEYRKALGRG